MKSEYVSVVSGKFDHMATLPRDTVQNCVREDKGFRKHGQSQYSTSVVDCTMKAVCIRSVKASSTVQLITDWFFSTVPYSFSTIQAAPSRSSLPYTSVTSHHQLHTDARYCIIVEPHGTTRVGGGWCKCSCLFSCNLLWRIAVVRDIRKRLCKAPEAVQWIKVCSLILQQWITSLRGRCSTVTSADGVHINSVNFLLATGFVVVTTSWRDLVVYTTKFGKY